MKKDKKNNKKLIIIIGILAAIIIICLLIPAKIWTPKISSGRYANEAVICEIDKSNNLIKIQINNALEKDKLTNNFATLQGNIQENAFVGQNIMIGYSKEKLLNDSDQFVQIAYNENSNLLWKAIVSILPIDNATDDYHVVDTQLDGNQISYTKVN